MNSGIPFIRVANRVEVSVNLKWNRISGPPPNMKQWRNSGWPNSTRGVSRNNFPLESTLAL